MADRAVAADHAAEVAAAVVVVDLRRLGERADAEQRVAEREVRPPVVALLGAGDVLPAAVGEEPVVAAGDQLGAVLQRDPPRRPDVDQWSSTGVAT